MHISAFVGQELANIPLVEVSAQSWPFDFVAPLAAWFWIDTRFRRAAESAFAGLKSVNFEAIISCGCLDDVAVKCDERLLSGAYHRALLEILVPIHPQWQLECNELGQLRCLGSVGRRLEGQQFGMLDVFPDIRVLANHLEIDVAQLVTASETAGIDHERPRPRHHIRPKGLVSPQRR